MTITFGGGEEEKTLNEQILNIKIDGTSTARVKVTINGQDKIALIDTGAGRCCMNEEHYQMLGSPPLKPPEAYFKLRTASGALMPGMGFLTCNIQIGSEYYNQQFIVCKQLTPGLILGRDFLARNQLGITWGPKGVLQLRDDQNVQMQAMEETTICNAELTANVTIPSRSLAAVTVKMILPSCQNKTRFSFTPVPEKALLGPNCVIYPLDYATNKGGLQRGIQIVVNLSCQEIQLPEGLILGQFQQNAR